MMPATSRVDSPLPSGTVTFMFTDIEGSTEMWEHDSAAMQVALARHDAILRNAIESSSGHVFKTTGDGMYVVFAEAAAALAACVTAQRALQQMDGNAGGGAQRDVLSRSLRVRMALHTGVAECRNDDYFGASVNRTARIMSVAHGGQVLLSTTTMDALAGDLPTGVTLRDVGEHRLKGLPRPERLLQVVSDGLRADFPPLASLTGMSLPAERDVFVGRSDALHGLTRYLRDGARLVSVIGIGGIGKTRLITRFAWISLGTFPGGIWFCDLAQARSLDGVVYAAAQGLEMSLGKEDPVTQIGNAIAGRGRCLVILDNFEQVARHAEDTLGRWLDRAPEARFIVTTREVLGLSGEQVFALSPLTPSDAVALFMRRAEAARPGFEANAEDQSVITELMRLLEGLPLAIELAATRLRIMSPKTLLAKMNERFKLLSSTGGRVDRQATLRAVFDWSWELLSMPEKSALAQLSVFEGGFTVEAVEAVLDVSDCEAAPSALDLLQSLLQKSLVRQLADDRFDLLVSVQEYAASQLRTPGAYAQSGGAALAAAELRHGRYFANMDEHAATANGCAELDNLVAACRRAVARADPEIAAPTLEGAWAGLNLRGPYRSSVELASLVQTIPGLGGSAAAKVHSVAGAALAAAGRYGEACAELRAALAQAHDAGDLLCECRARVRLGFIDANMSRFQSAGAQFEAALILARAANESAQQSDALNGLGSVSQCLGRMREARVHFEAGLKSARQAGDKHRESNVLGNLASLCTDCGRMDEARAHHESALAAAREVGNRKLEGSTLCNLGLMNYVQTRYSEALDQLEAALALAGELGHSRMECIASCNLGMVYDRLERFDEAADQLQNALRLARELGDPRLEGQVLGYLGLLLGHQDRFDEARHCLGSGEALLRTHCDRSSFGVVLCNRAEVEFLSGEGDVARKALATAEAIAKEIDVSSAAELGVTLRRVRKLLDLA